MELSCTDTAAVIWQGSAFTGQCPSESDTITVLAAQAVVGSITTCGNFTANVTDLTPSPTVPGLNIVDVSVTFRADVSLNGTTVQCEDANPNNDLLVNKLLDIPGILGLYAVYKQIYTVFIRFKATLQICDTGSLNVFQFSDL